MGGGGLEYKLWEPSPFSSPVVRFQDRARRVPGNKKAPGVLSWGFFCRYSRHSAANTFCYSTSDDFDPVELTLGPRVYETTMMKGVFGALRDASADSWGRRIIDRHAGKLPLCELDYLLESPDDRAGRT
jgi:hypothetical protein